MREGTMANAASNIGNIAKTIAYIVLRALTHNNQYYFVGHEVQLTAEEAKPFLKAGVVKLAPVKQAE
jgi:hypothetical protein